MNNSQTAYYFGDLQCVFNDKNWDKLLEVFDESKGFYFSFINNKGKNVNFFIAYTAFGNGFYYSYNYDGFYTVKQFIDLFTNSGAFGLVKIEDCDVSIDEILENKSGIVFEVEEEDKVNLFVKTSREDYCGGYHEIFVSQNYKNIFSVITAEKDEDEDEDELN